MNLRNRIAELESKYPAIRDMEVECTFEDGHIEWLTVEGLKKCSSAVSIGRCRHSSLPGLDKLLDFMREVAQ